MHGKAGPVKIHTVPGAHLLLGVPAGALLAAVASWSHLGPNKRETFVQLRGESITQPYWEVTTISAKEKPPALPAAAASHPLP